MPAFSWKSLGRERDPGCNSGTKETSCSFSPLNAVSPVQQRRGENEQALRSARGHFKTRPWRRNMAGTHGGCQIPLVLRSFIQDQQNIKCVFSTVCEMFLSLLGCLLLQWRHTWSSFNINTHANLFYDAFNNNTHIGLQVLIVWLQLNWSIHHLDCVISGICPWDKPRRLLCVWPTIWNSKIFGLQWYQTEKAANPLK